VDESLRALLALVGVAQVEEAIGEGGSDVIESRVHSRGGRGAVGAMVLLVGQIRAQVGRAALAYGLFLKGTRVRARFDGRQHEELVLRMERG